MAAPYTAGTIPADEWERLYEKADEMAWLTGQDMEGWLDALEAQWLERANNV